MSTALTFDDILLIPRFSDIGSRDEVSLQTDIGAGIGLNIPIISSNMSTITGAPMAYAMNMLGGIGILPRTKDVDTQLLMLTTLHGAHHLVLPDATRADSSTMPVEDAAYVRQCMGRTPVIVSLGPKCDDIKNVVGKFLDYGTTGIALDAAHGHSEMMVGAIRTIRYWWPNTLIIAGNVATAEAAEDLWEAGADCVRVGIGSGSICTTRIVTGFGVPQVTALNDIGKLRDKTWKNKRIIADGGIRNSGDIVKSLALGADAVILGSLLAGTDESAGGTEYNGSTSITEKNRQGKSVNYIEGVEATVSRKGPLSSVIQELVEGIRSGLSYAGARTIDELRGVEYNRISSASWAESQAHIRDIQANAQRA